MIVVMMMVVQMMMLNHGDGDGDDVEATPRAAKKVMELFFATPW